MTSWTLDELWDLAMPTSMGAPGLTTAVQIALGNLPGLTQERGDG